MLRCLAGNAACTALRGGCLSFCRSSRPYCCCAWRGKPAQCYGARRPAKTISCPSQTGSTSACFISLLILQIATWKSVVLGSLALGALAVAAANADGLAALWGGYSDPASWAALGWAGLGPGALASYLHVMVSFGSFVQSVLLPCASRVPVVCRSPRSVAAACTRNWGAGHASPVLLP